MRKAIFIGYDAREHEAYQIAVRSTREHLSEDIPIYPIVLGKLVQAGLYWRETETRDGRLWDVISGAPMSTTFAITRFAVPIIASADWAVFMDCDVLLRADMGELFALADESKAIQVVPHDYKPSEATKMDGQVQTSYPRKNQSSVMLWNLGHEAHRALTVEVLNSWTGRRLHAFDWLAEDEIGYLPPEWNHLVGVNAPNIDAKLAHLTLGIPTMKGYEQCEFAEEWRSYASHDLRAT